MTKKQVWRYKCDFCKKRGLAVTSEVNEKGAGGYLLARLTDAKQALTKPT